MDTCHRMALGHELATDICTLTLLTGQQRSCHQTFKVANYTEQKNINPRRVEGTCLWALQSPEYIRWSESTCHDLLWVSADPGCGKSVGGTSQAIFYFLIHACSSLCLLDKESSIWQTINQQGDPHLAYFAVVRLAGQWYLIGYHAQRHQHNMGLSQPEAVSECILPLRPIVTGPLTHKRLCSFSGLEILFMMS